MVFAVWHLICNRINTEKTIVLYTYIYWLEITFIFSDWEQKNLTNIQISPVDFDSVSIKLTFIIVSWLPPFNYIAKVFIRIDLGLYDSIKHTKSEKSMFYV